MAQKLNMEIKARCKDPQKIRAILQELHAVYKGCDHQIDTYFPCEQGRLKLRKGNIENSLIFYQRSNQKGPKESAVFLQDLPSHHSLTEILSKAYGVMVIVDKRRHIYFIDNVKFHVDEVTDLGSFMEIEAITSEVIETEEDRERFQKQLKEQCDHYLKIFQIPQEDFIDGSYSDLLLRKNL